MIKIQDLAFVLVLFFLLWRRNIRLAIVAGLVCLLLAMALFHFWIFFTAERLTWYAAAFFFYAIVRLLLDKGRENENRH